MSGVAYNFVILAAAALGGAVTEILYRLGAGGRIVAVAGAKGGVGRTRLAIELAAHRIRVNYVCPTAVETSMGGIIEAPATPAGHGERLVQATGSWNLLDEGALLGVDLHRVLHRLVRVDDGAVIASTEMEPS